MVFAQHEHAALVMGALAGCAVSLLVAIASVSSLAVAAMVLGYPAAAAVVLALLWTDRVEVYDDRVVSWRVRQRSEIRLESVTEVRVEMSTRHAGFYPGCLARVHLVGADGTKVALPPRAMTDLYNFLDTVGRPIARRAHAAMSRSETVTFAEDTSFPFRDTLSLGAALAVTLAAFTVSLRVAPALFALAVVPAALTLSLGTRMLGALRRWRNACRVGGVAVSTQGLRPALDSGKPVRFVRPNDPFRGASGLAAGWIPWSTVRLAWLTAKGIALYVDSRAEPIYLSEHTHNLVPLWHLIRELCPPRAEQADAPTRTGVRVDVSSGEDFDEATRTSAEIRSAVH